MNPPAPSGWLSQLSVPDVATIGVASESSTVCTSLTMVFDAGYANRDSGKSALSAMSYRPQVYAVLAGAAGGAIAIGLMEAFSIQTAFPLAAIPFATSIVTVLGSPKAGPAQPRALIGGHLLSTLVGLLVVKICGPMPWAAAVAVGLAMVAMHLTRTFHPPAGIDPLVVVTNDLSWSFLIVPVAVGALLLALFAFTWHNLVGRGPNKGDTWPEQWW